MKKIQHFAIIMIISTIFYAFLYFIQSTLITNNPYIVSTSIIYSIFTSISPIPLLLFSTLIVYIFYILFTHFKSTKIKIITCFYIISLLLISYFVGNELYRVTNTNPFPDSYIALHTKELPKKYETLPDMYFIGTNFSKEEALSIVNSYILNQPVPLLENAEIIYLYTHDNYIKLKHSNDNIASMAFSDINTHEIFVDLSYVKELKNNITHELAHVYDFKIYNAKNNNEFNDMYTKTIKQSNFQKLNSYINVEYASTSVREFFAECSIAYFNFPREMKKYAPELYMFYNHFIFPKN